MAEYDDGEIKVNPPRGTIQEESEMRRSAGSPMKYEIGSHHEKQGGLRYASNRAELEGVHKGSDMHRPRHKRQVSREEGDMRSLRNENANQKSGHNSPYHRNGGETPKRLGRQSVGSDHPQARATGGKGSAMSSPSWERKGLSEGAIALSPSTPLKSRLRSVTKGDDTPDDGTAVPKFGDWNDNDPSSTEGLTRIFDEVRKEKQSGTGKVPTMPNETSYANGQKRISSTSSKGCGCFPWSR